MKAYRIIVKRNMEIVDSEKKIELPHESATVEEKLSEVIHRKYASSKLKDDEKSKLFERLIKRIEIEQVYLDPDLTLKTLADSLDTNSKYLSQVINESFNQTFNNFINVYRVKEARKRISSQPNYTFEHIALEVGFNSKSSFNAAFKKHIGVTPSFYIQSSKDIKNKIGEH